MQITDEKELLNLEDNQFIGELPKLKNSQININGSNNILVCEDEVILANSRIDFNGNNSILYLSSSTFQYFLNISINGNNVCFIGKNNYFNGRTTIVLSESKNVVIGDDCLFSYAVAIRVADVHLVYDSRTRKRLNYSKSIYIGDHVWLGQNSMIFKGTKIGSGSLIGAGSVVSNKKIPSNTTFAGSPVRSIHSDSFWVGYSVHPWDEEDTQKYSKYDSDEYMYRLDDTTLDLDEIEQELNGSIDPESLVKYIETTFLGAGKNRFTLR